MPQSPPRRFQYGVGTLLLAAIPVALLAALGGMLGQSAGRPGIPAPFFVLLAIATPLALVIVGSLIRFVIFWWKNCRR